jgi:thymidylate synthase ThyX
MAFARVVKLRNAKDAQLETRAIAKDIDTHMNKLFPVSWSALCGS